MALAFYDAREQFVTANHLAQRAAAIAGFTLDEPPYAGDNVRGADKTSPIPLEQQIIPRALRGDITSAEIQWIGPLGAQIAIIASSRRVYRSDRTLWGTLISAHDVTGLARAVEVKDEFVQTVSHELRTPLTSILGYLEVLTEEPDIDADFRTSTLARIRRSALNLETRIEELLAAGSAGQTARLEVTDATALTRLVRRVHATFAQQARDSHIELGITTAPATPTTNTVLVNAPRLEQAIENVVSNALKYTSPGGHVTITLTHTPDTAQIRVTDTGIGMTPDDLEQAFEMFWRAPTARTNAIQGIGIGLALVRAILDEHHGHVDLTSKPGNGTTLTLSLPAHRRA